jgi:MFS transporter, Spinster family, sphingosine-1-phosphate transporter
VTGAPSTSAEAAQGPSRAAPGAALALLVLTGMNLLNYVDRWVPSAVKDLLKTDLELSDAQTSYPLTAFLVVYMATSPIFGALAEKYPRRILVALGVASWSVATASAALAQGFWSLLFTRAAVGIGEAAYATLAPAILSDFFPPQRRNLVFTLFYAAIPVGSALGYVLGGVLGTHFGWRAAFLIAGLPGLLLAGLVLLVAEPKRGQFDPDPPRPVSWPEALKALSVNRTFLVAVAGYTAVSFATGGIADWFPTFLSRYRHMDLQWAGLVIGASAAIGGLGGTTWGGLVADLLAKRVRQPYFALSGLAMVPAAALAAVALVVPRGIWSIAATVTAAQLFLWAYNAPINALVVNSVNPALRARAVGVSILVIHLAGDALSPSIIGLLSDASGRLDLALFIVPVAVAIGAAIWLSGWRRLPA